MDILTEEQRMLLENVRRVAKQKIAPAAAELDRRGEFSWETASLFWDLGLLQIMLPEEYGGWPFHPCHTLCLCIEEIAKACASSALMLIIQAVGSFPLIHAGNDFQKKKYFPMLSEQRKLIGYLVTEPGAGSDVAAITTKAQKQGHHYVLTGQKTFATNGGVAGLYSVLARTGENALSFFIVERPWKGVTIGKHEDKCGFRGSDTSEVLLEDVEVPEENLVGKEGGGFLIAMADFDMSRPTVAALSLGIAEGALDYATEYAGQRQDLREAPDRAPAHSVYACGRIDSDRGRERAHGKGRLELRCRTEEHHAGIHGQVLLQRCGHEDHHGHGAGAGRVRVHQGLPCGEDVQGREADTDLRGGQSNSANDHRPGDSEARGVSDTMPDGEGGFISWIFL